jgi:hypothetical protein
MSASTSARRDALVTVLKAMQKKVGFVGPIVEGRDRRLLVIFRDSPITNISVIENTRVILSRLTDLRLIDLVGTEGAPKGELDTSLLTSIPDKNIQKKTIDGLMSKGRLSAAEYVAMNSTTPIHLYGAEDWPLYLQARDVWLKLAPLWEYLHEHEASMSQENLAKAVNTDPKLTQLARDYQQFDELVRRRADVFVTNLLQGMSEFDCEACALICRGHLPEYISSVADRKSLSHVIIDLAKTTKDQLRVYEELIGAKETDFAALLAGPDVRVTLPKKGIRDRIERVLGRH